MTITDARTRQQIVTIALEMIPVNKPFFGRLGLHAPGPFLWLKAKDGFTRDTFLVCLSDGNLLPTTDLHSDLIHDYQPVEVELVVKRNLPTP